jgi:hypothetical protein
MFGVTFYIEGLKTAAKQAKFVRTCVCVCGGVGYCGNMLKNMDVEDDGRKLLFGSNDYDRAKCNPLKYRTILL